MTDAKDGRTPKEFVGLSLLALGVVFGESSVVVSSEPPMARWRLALFSRMKRNSQRAQDYFQIPPNRVVALGAQVEL